MKKTLVCITGVVFLVAALAFAADKPASEAAKGSAAKVNAVKTTKMNARGMVVDVTEKTIKIERTIKGNKQTMEFALDKPVENIAVNDSVKIDYSEKDGTLTASRVAKLADLKKSIRKEAQPAMEKSAQGTK